MKKVLNLIMTGVLLLSNCNFLFAVSVDEFNGLWNMIANNSDMYNNGVYYNGSGFEACVSEHPDRGCVRYANRQVTGSFENEGDVEIRKLVLPTSRLGEFEVDLMVRGKDVSQINSASRVCSVVVFDKSTSMWERTGSGGIINPGDSGDNHGDSGGKTGDVISNTCSGFVLGNNICYYTGDKRNNAVSGAIEFSNLMINQYENSLLGLVLFGKTATIQMGLTHNPFSESLFDVVPETSTNIHDGLIKAGEILSGADCDKKIIVLMSDGVPTKRMEEVDGERVLVENNGTGFNSYTGAAIQEALNLKNLEEKPIEIFSIGYGISSGSAIDTLKQIASEPTESHYKDASEDNITDIFNEIGNSQISVNAGTIISIIDSLGENMTGDSVDTGHGDAITSSGRVYGPFTIRIDPGVSGWNNSNNGLFLNYSGTGGNTILEIPTDISSEIYWDSLVCSGTIPGGDGVLTGKGEFSQVWNTGISDGGCSGLCPKSKDWYYTGYSSLLGECEWTCKDGYQVRNDESGCEKIVTTYTVEFNGNGATAGVMGAQNIAVDTPANLNPNEYEKVGYTFSGWNTNPKGYGDWYSDNELVTNLTTAGETVLLYAQWTANNYTIVFHGNGATNGSMNNQIMTYDEAKKLLENNFTRLGYTFSGWNTQSDGGGTWYSDEQSVLNLATNGTVDLYAQWTADTYTVIFDGNGATAGIMLNQSIKYDENTFLNENEYERDGYTFLGWNTLPNGSGTSYGDHQAVSNLVTSGSITLYAQRGTNTYTVEYNNNGGNGSMPSQNIEYDRLTKLYKNTYTKEGYVFSGWNTKANGIGKSYEDEESVINLVLSGLIVLYAQWVPNSYTIVFDGNGATSGEMFNQSMVYDSEVKLDKNNYIKDGFVFLGWNTELDGKGKSYSDEAPVKNLATSGTVTLYAQWGKNNTGGGSSGGGGKTKDYCPDGDYSGDFYDKKCGSKINTGKTEVNTDEKSVVVTPVVNEKLAKKCSIEGSKHSKEVNDAYIWACENGIINSNTIQGAKLGEFLNRAEMAKIVTVFEMLVLDAKPDRNKDCSAFADSISSYNSEMRNYMITSCQLERMGIHTADHKPISDFMPKKFVSRAEFGTILSRVLWGNKYEASRNSSKYYVQHLNSLKGGTILSNINPDLKERRSYAVLMIYRAAKSLGKA